MTIAPRPRLVAYADDAGRTARVEALVTGLAALPDDGGPAWETRVVRDPARLDEAAADALLVDVADPAAFLAVLPLVPDRPVFVITDAGADPDALRALGARAHLPAAEATPLLLQRTLWVAERGLHVEGQLERLAQHDVLTGLPNRRLFERQLAHALHGARRHGRRLGVGRLTLDGFTDVVARHGQTAAEALLTFVAGRLQGALRRSDLVARDVDDAFLLLLDCGGDLSDLAATADKLRRIVRTPVPLRDGDVTVRASIGLAVFPHSATEGAALLAEAARLRDAVAADGGDDFRFRDVELTVVSREDLDIEAALPGALGRDEFELRYQPRLDLRTDRITGAEVLLRWSSPEHGWVDPSRFIPLAEASGAIGRIGAWVLREAVADAAGWAEAGHPVRLGVNVSAAQIVDDESAFTARVRSVLDDAGLEPSLLELELTERVFLGPEDEHVRRFDELAALGVGLAVDDFGIGYSSLSYLKHFPVHTLKIDRSFVDPVPGPAGDEALVRAIVALGHALGLRVVAEGVERPAQLDFLRAAGCDEVQGFLVSPGVTEREFVALLLAHEPRPLEDLDSRPSLAAPDPDSDSAPDLDLDLDPGEAAP